MNTLPKRDWQPNRQHPQTQGLNRPMAWIGVMLLAMLVVLTVVAVRRYRDTVG